MTDQTNDNVVEIAKHEIRIVSLEEKSNKAEKTYSDIHDQYLQNDFEMKNIKTSIKELAQKLDQFLKKSTTKIKSFLEWINLLYRPILLIGFAAVFAYGVHRQNIVNSTINALQKEVQVVVEKNHLSQ